MASRQRRSGRRPGTTDTRAEILSAARNAFAGKGYDGASIRAIAAGAGVDPALVLHYFGSKDKLFLASVGAPFDPADLLPAVVAAPRDELGVRVVRLLLDVWDSPAGAAAVALLRSGMTNEMTARLLREFVHNQLLRHVIDGLDLDETEAPTRSTLVATQLVGLAVIRYIFRLEPITSAPPEQLAATIGPTIQRYLTGPLVYFA